MFYLYVCMFYFLISLPHTSTTSPNISAENGYFWQLTDVHLDLNYLEHGCKGELGDYQCDSPLELWISALNNTRQISPFEPEFIIFSGDSVAHDTSLSKERFLKTMQDVAAAIRTVFPESRGIPVIPVMGNHDMYPDNALDVQDSSMERIDWCTKLGSNNTLWGEWIRPVGMEPFSNGCYFSRRLEIATSSQPNSPTTPLVIISVNGMVWYMHNVKSDPKLIDPVGQFAWLEATLEKAREDSAKVLLISHFAPGGTDNSPSKYRHMHPSYNIRFLELVTSYADIIIGGLFAHQHADSFRILSDKMGKPVASFFLTPSVSPMNLTGLGSLQPRIRSFEFTRSPSLALLDIHQLYLNLSATSPIWQREYSMRSTFELSSLSPDVLVNGLIADFLVNETKWSLFWNYQLGLGMEHASGPCPKLDTLRRCQNLCSLVYLDYTKLDECLDRCNANPAPTFDVISVPLSFKVSPSSLTSTSWNTLPVIVAVIIAFLVILIGVVFLVNREICRRRRSCSTGPGVASRPVGMVAPFVVEDGAMGDLTDNNAIFNYSDIHWNEYPDSLELDVDATRGLYRSQKGGEGDSSRRLEDDDLSFRTPGRPFGGKLSSDTFPATRHSREGLNINSYSNRQLLPTISPLQSSFNGTPVRVEDFEFSSRRHEYADDDPETAYDAEVEDDDLEEEELCIRHHRQKSNGIVKNGVANNHIKTSPVRRCLLPDFSSRLLLGGPKLIDDSRTVGGDTSDNEYYSIHSSLQYLQPVDVKPVRGSRNTWYPQVHHPASSTSSAMTGEGEGSHTSLSSAHLTPTHPRSHSPTYSPVVGIIGGAGGGRGLVVVPFADA